MCIVYVETNSYLLYGWCCCQESLPKRSEYHNRTYFSLCKALLLSCVVWCTKTKTNLFYPAAFLSHLSMQTNEMKRERERERVIWQLFAKRVPFKAHFSFYSPLPSLEFHNFFCCCFFFCFVSISYRILCYFPQYFLL